MKFNYKITPRNLQLGVKRIAIRDNLTFIILGAIILIYGLISLGINAKDGSVKLPLILAFMGLILIALSAFRVLRATINAKRIFSVYKQDYEMEYELSLDDEYLINKRIDATKAVGKYERFFIAKVFFVKDFVVVRMFNKSNLIIPSKFVSSVNRVKLLNLVTKLKTKTKRINLKNK